MHNIIPHHHHFEFHQKTDNKECIEEHDLENHSTAKHCHAFNTINFYNKNYKKYTKKIQLNIILLLSVYKPLIKRYVKERKRNTNQSLKYQTPDILMQLLRAPPSSIFTLLTSK